MVMCSALKPRGPLSAGFLFVLLLCATGASAQWQQWVPGADYDPAIPDPETWLGRPFAAQSIGVDEIRGYLEALDAASERVAVEYIGESVQGDPLMLVVVTDPALRDLVESRAGRVSTIADAWSADREERLAIAREEPAVCLIACSVHGDEASGADAGVLLAYHLAADRSAATQRILGEIAVVIDPCQNPDGRRRFLHQVRSFGRQRLEPDPSPWAAEHWGTWPGARTNHFLFDLNRDWAFLTQSESRARVEAFRRWRPQVYVDLHEMGRQSSYFFPPPTDPINPHIPADQLAWFDVFGRANASAFDDYGFDYFVGESFDLFYPGFGDSWPTLQGAIGMTYEQASTRGRRMRRPDGTVAGYPAAVQHHFVASLTTVETTARHSAELMESLVGFGDTMRERSEKDARREIVVSVETGGAQARRLADVLTRQGIRVLRTREPVTVRLRDLDEELDVEREVELPAGSYRIPLEQPGYALVRSLLDQHVGMGTEFIEEEEARVERGLNPRVYDVTAWSMILGYGVEAGSVDRRLEVPSDPVRVGDLPAAGTVADANVAWLIPCRDNSIYPALSRLWERRINVHCALEGVGANGELFPRGTLVVKRASNGGRSDLRAILEEVAMVTGAPVVSVDRSYSGAGPSLGSDQVVLASQPRIALLSGPGVSPLSAGALTWLFEERYGLEFTVLLREKLEDIAVEEFDVIVVPELRRGGDLPLARLDGWVREGGVLVAIGSASLALIEEDGEEAEAWTTVQRVDDLAQLSDEEGRLGEIEVGQPALDPQTMDVLPPERRPLRVPGAIFRVDLDDRHFLTMGKPAWVAVPVLSDRILTPSIGGRTVGRIAAERPMIAGYTWPVMAEALKSQAWLVEESRGRGRVVIFAEDPSFRGTWEGLHALLLNAILIGPSLGR
jgi:hypothetical protein